MDLLPYLGVGVGGIVASIAAADYMFPWLKYDFQYLKKLLPIVRKLKQYEKSGVLMVDEFERQCRKIPQKTCVIFKV